MPIAAAVPRIVAKTDDKNGNNNSVPQCVHNIVVTKKLYIPFECKSFPDGSFAVVEGIEDKYGNGRIKENKQDCNVNF